MAWRQNLWKPRDQEKKGNYGHWCILRDKRRYKIILGNGFQKRAFLGSIFTKNWIYLRERPEELAVKSIRYIPQLCSWLLLVAITFLES
jgi:hypothetical protein